MRSNDKFVRCSLCECGDKEKHEYLKKCPAYDWEHHIQRYEKLRESVISKKEFRVDTSKHNIDFKNHNFNGNFVKFGAHHSD